MYVYVLNLSHTYKNALAKAHNAPTSDSILLSDTCQNNHGPLTSKHSQGHYDYSGICRKYDRSYLYVCILNLSHTYKKALAKAHNAPTLIPSPFFLESASVTSTIPVTLEPKIIRALLLWLSVTYYRWYLLIKHAMENNSLN